MDPSTAAAPRRTAPPRLDVAIARLAGRQHGVVSLAQLTALGLSARAAQDRVGAGRLHRVHRGVYAVGHARLSADGVRMAAVLACGDGAVLSHRSAARLWGLIGGTGGRVEITVGRSGGRQGPASVRLCRTRRLSTMDVTVVRGIPVTTVARTLLDLSDVLDAQRLQRAVHEAEVGRLLDVTAVRAVIARHPGRRREATLQEALGTPAADPANSVFAAAFAALCRDHGLPAPHLGVHLDLDGRLAEVDALFPEARVIVELDGEQVHHTRRSFHRDRRRDSAFAALGFVVVRLTWQRVEREAAVVADELRRTLQRGVDPSNAV